MMNKNKSKLDRKKRYLQVALNNTLEEARSIIEQLPPDNRILIEAGTPLIKQYGEKGIRKIAYWWSEKLYGRFTINPRFALSSLSHPLQLQNEITEIPYSYDCNTKYFRVKFSDCKETHKFCDGYLLNHLLLQQILTMMGT